MLNSVGATFFNMGAVCVCVAVTARHSGGSLMFFCKRFATSATMEAGMPRLSTVISTPGA
jgi:hypothetical protein